MRPKKYAISQHTRKNSSSKFMFGLAKCKMLNNVENYNIEQLQSQKFKIKSQKPVYWNFKWH